MTTRTRLGVLRDANGTECAVEREVSQVDGERLTLVLDAGEMGYIPFVLDTDTRSDLMRMLAGEKPRPRLKRVK